MLDITIDAKNRLVISIDPAFKDAVRGLVASEMTPDNIWCELLESFSCNGSYAYFNAGNGDPFVGLSSAPCIADALDYTDDGRAKVVGRFWYFARYELENELESLANCGKVVFDFGGEVTQ